MALPSYEINRKLSNLTGKISREHTLELNGPPESIKLFLERIEITRKVLLRESCESYGETPPLNLVVTKIKPTQICLIGEWEIFNKIFEQYSVKIEKEICPPKVDAIKSYS